MKKVISLIAVLALFLTIGAPVVSAAEEGAGADNETTTSETGTDNGSGESENGSSDEDTDTDSDEDTSDDSDSSSDDESEDEDEDEAVNSDSNGKGKGRFSDVESGYKHQNAIKYLGKHKVFQGYPDGTFKPENTVNRAELMKILVVGQGIEVDSGNYKNCFPDVKEEWFSPYVCYAKEQGWVAGYPDGKFAPAKPVNRAEAAKMMINALDVELAESGDNFGDVVSNEWFAKFAKTVRNRNLLGVQKFGPASGMTRAEVAEMLYRILVIKQQSSDEFSDSAEENFDEEAPIELITFTNRTKEIVENAVEKVKNTVNEGIELILEDKNAEALKKFNMAAYHAPKAPRAWTGKAYAHYNLEEYKSARYAVNHAIKVNKYRPVNYLVKALVMYALDMPNRAEASYTYALTLREILEIEETLPSASELTNYTEEEIIEMIIEEIETAAEASIEASEMAWDNYVDEEDTEEISDYEYDEDEEKEGTDDDEEDEEEESEDDTDDDSDDSEDDSTDDTDDDSDDSEDDSTDDTDDDSDDSEDDTEDDDSV